MAGRSGRHWWFIDEGRCPGQLTLGGELVRTGDERGLGAEGDGVAPMAFIGVCRHRRGSTWPEGADAICSLRVHSGRGRMAGEGTVLAG